MRNSLLGRTSAILTSPKFPHIHLDRSWSSPNAHGWDSVWTEDFVIPDPSHVKFSSDNFFGKENIPLIHSVIVCVYKCINISPHNNKTICVIAQYRKIGGRVCFGTNHNCHGSSRKQDPSPIGTNKHSRFGRQSLFRIPQARLFHGNAQ